MLILMIFNTIDDRTNGYRSKGKRKSKSNQGLNAFAFLRLVILLLESENLVEDFLYYVFFLLWIYHRLVLARTLLVALFLG